MPLKQGSSDKVKKPKESLENDYEEARDFDYGTEDISSEIRSEIKNKDDGKEEEEKEESNQNKSDVSKTTDKIISDLEKDFSGTQGPQRDVRRNQQLIERYYEYLSEQTHKIFLGDNHEISLKNGLKLLIFKVARDSFTGAVLSYERNVPLATFENLDLSALVVDMADKGFITERSFYSILEDGNATFDNETHTDNMGKGENMQKTGHVPGGDVIDGVYPDQNVSCPGGKIRSRGQGRGLGVGGGRGPIGRQADNPKKYDSLESEDLVRAAIASFGKAEVYEKYSSSERKTVANQITKAAKKFGIEVSDDWKERHNIVKSQTEFLDSCFEALEKGDLNKANELSKTFMGYDSIKYTPSNRSEAMEVVIKPQQEAFDMTSVDTGNPISDENYGTNDFGLTEIQKEVIKMLQKDLHVGAKVVGIYNVYDGSYNICLLGSDNIEHRYNLSKEGVSVKMASRKVEEKFKTKVDFPGTEVFGKADLSLGQSLFTKNWNDKSDKESVEDFAKSQPNFESAFDKRKDLGELRVHNSESQFNKMTDNLNGLDFSKANGIGGGAGSRGGKVVGYYSDGTPAYASQQYKPQTATPKKKLLK